MKLASLEFLAITLAMTTSSSKTPCRPRSALDTIIVATAEANGCVVVTDNERDFPGVETFNPIRPGARH